MEIPVPFPVFPINPYIGYPGGGGHHPRPIRLDFSYAPDSYGTTLAADGARRQVPALSTANKVAPLMIGASIDTEEDGIPSVVGELADGDDLLNIDGREKCALLKSLVITISFKPNSTADSRLFNDDEYYILFFLIILADVIYFNTNINTLLGGILCDDFRTI